MQAPPLFVIPHSGTRRASTAFRTGNIATKGDRRPTSLSRVPKGVSLAGIGLDQVLNSRLYE